MPTARALEAFNGQGVWQINLAHFPDAPVQAVVDDIKRILVARHGREDFTVKPQQQLLSTLSTVLNVLKFAVAALGGISLLVGAVGMVTLMHIAVSERVSEIGLLTALGATRVAHPHLISAGIHRTVHPRWFGGADHRSRHCRIAQTSD